MNERPTAAAGGDARVDELRRHLKALGYLDAGVNRFVLGPAEATRSPTVIALLASLRIGLIAAILLGPAAAIGVAGRMPGLVTGTRDGIVIALYLGVLFGTAVMVAAFGAAVLLANVARSGAERRARTLARVAGAIIASASVVYLTLWWRTANAGPQWAAPVWTAFALVFAVALSLLLGHAVAVMELAVVMARGSSPDRTGVTASSLFSWKLSFAAGLVALAGGAVLLVTSSPAEGRLDAPAPALTVVPSGLRVRLVAIDGFDTAIFDELSRQRDVPALSGAIGGARAQLAAEDSRDPARAWTTIATGQPPDAHGVYGLETRRLTGVQGSVPRASRPGAGRALQAATDLLRLTRPSLASGEERRVKTFWEVAADSGLRTVVVNWWATWPVPANTTATILSDRAALRLELGGALDAEIAPAVLYDQLRGEWGAIRRTASGRVTPIVQSPDAGVEEIIRRAAELDALQITLAERVRGEDPDLLTVYLPGLDIAQHALFGEDAARQPPSAVAARLEALRGYYRFLDRLLGELLAPAPRELVFLVTGPGRVAGRGAAWLGARGGAAGDARADARATDVAPTILYALGLPHSRELAGRPCLDLFRTDHVARYAVREIATYGRPSATASARSGQPLDDEMIDRLRSLGYVR